MTMNVLAGLAEGVVDAVLESEHDPERDPFALALQRYRSGGAPEEVFGVWRANAAPASPRGTDRVLRALGRDLLVDVVGYATTLTEEPAEPDREPDTGPTLAVIGERGAMPALELGSDGTWHVAERAGVEARGAGDRATAKVPSLASRYPVPRLPDRY